MLFFSNVIYNCLIDLKDLKFLKLLNIIGEFKKIMKKIILVLFLSFYCVMLSYSYGPGTAAVPFLKIGIGAKPVSMGEAFTAVGDGVYSVYWNPAHSSKMIDKRFQATHIVWIEDIVYDHIGMIYPVKEVGTISLEYSLLNYGKIPRTTNSPEPVGEMNATDSLLLLNYGKEINKQWGIGCNLKYVNQDYYIYHGYSLLVDLGLTLNKEYYILGNYRKIPLGLSILNIGRGFKLSEERTDYDIPPFEVKLGAGYNIKSNLLVGIDIAKPIDNEVNISIGTQYGLMNNIILVRGGYKYKVGGNDLGPISGLRLGFGLNFYNMEVDYAFQPAGDIGLTHRLSMGYRFGETRILEGEKKGVIAVDSKEIGGIGEEVLRMRKEVLYFDPTESELKPEHKAILDKVKSIYTNNPDFSITIEGHNDIKESNRISRQRAELVMNALLNLNIPKKKIDVKWYGSNKPANLSITKEGLAQNRRVEIILWGKEILK